jgi:hypothetical protein
MATKYSAPEPHPLDELLLFLLTELERVAAMDHDWDPWLMATAKDRLQQLAAKLLQGIDEPQGV